MPPTQTQAGNKGNGMRNLKEMLGPNPGNNINTPSESSRSPTPTATVTQKKRGPPQLTASEIIALNNEVSNASSGKAYLERTALAINGKPYTTNAITEILLHITQLAGISLPAQTAVRAIAFILKETELDKTTDTIARHVTAAISPHIAKLQNTEEKLTQLATDINTKSTTQNINIEKLQSTIDNLTTRMEETVAARPTYASTLTSGQCATPASETQNQQAQCMAREAIKDRQIMLSFDTNSPLAAGKASHAQLVTLVKNALSKIDVNVDSLKLEMRSVTQFKNGGMMIELTTKEAATYIRNKSEIKNKLIQELDPDATFKERSYPLIVPFIPISYNPTDADTIRSLETENNWKEGTILSARWVKPAEKRSSTQKVAHLMLIFTDPAIANIAIRNGITVDHLLLWPKKNRREPLRCAKCQLYGHIARECIAQGDTCANCGNHHRTSDCSTKDKHFCTACNSDDHTSWSRDCPSFIQKCIDTDKRYPDNTMPYFPTSESWTQVSTPPKAPPYRKPTPKAQNNTLTQQRLDEYPTRRANNNNETYTRGEGTSRTNRTSSSRGYAPNRTSTRPRHEPNDESPYTPSLTQASQHDYDGWK